MPPRRGIPSAAAWQVRLGSGSGMTSGLLHEDGRLGPSNRPFNPMLHDRVFSLKPRSSTFLLGSHKDWMWKWESNPIPWNGPMESAA
jgi:hypothetical protein